MRISLVVPTLNEGGVIEILLARLDAVARTLRLSNNELEVIIVDDRSTDGTPEIIRRIKNGFSFTVILLERQIRDLATAVLDGMSLATGEIIGVLDADLSHPPELIPTLINGLARGEIVVASRHLPGGGVENWPYIRKFTSRLGAWAARAIGVKITDPMSGFFLFKRQVLAGVNLSPIGYKILLEILVKGYYDKVIELPYIFLNRAVGSSKLGPKVMINYLRHLNRLFIWKLKGFWRWQNWFNRD